MWSHRQGTGEIAVVIAAVWGMVSGPPTRLPCAVIMRRAARDAARLKTPRRDAEPRRRRCRCRRGGERGRCRSGRLVRRAMLHRRCVVVVAEAEGPPAEDEPKIHSSIRSSIRPRQSSSIVIGKPTVRTLSSRSTAGADRVIESSMSAPRSLRSGGAAPAGAQHAGSMAPPPPRRAGPHPAGAQENPLLLRLLTELKGHVGVNLDQLAFANRVDVVLAVRALIGNSTQAATRFGLGYQGGWSAGNKV